VAVAAVLAALAAGASAEHRVSFRFVVLGYVTDAGGRPVAAAPVSVVRDKTGLAYRARTGGDGLFVAITRLGDESAGETLTVQVGDRRTRIVARFDPANHADERGTRLDLEGGRFVERPAAFRPTLAEFLGH
jgi:hypothetical protein